MQSNLRSNWPKMTVFGQWTVKLPCQQHPAQKIRTRERKSEQWRKKTFLCRAFCIIMMPGGQRIHLKSVLCWGGETKIAVPDCHTIGLGCSVQLCRGPVCLSCSWLLHVCQASQPIRCIVTEAGVTQPGCYVCSITVALCSSLINKQIANKISIEKDVLYDWICICIYFFR